MAEKHRVVIRNFQEKGYREEFNLHSSKHIVEKIENGLNINLNHDEFYTEIETVQTEE